ncbi:MAG: class I SAM-dependent methyltransferase [Candidatus Nitrotoga sp.]
MTMEVLQDKLQIRKARQELVNKGASVIDSPLRTRLRKWRLVHGVTMGDMVKSWDVLTTINFLESHVKKDDPILDIGCYASEVIIALHKLGYSNLTGADLNPDLQKMPYQNAIRYELTNFMHTKFEDASFQAITSISVIEHGFDGQALLKEMSRLLKPSGYFIASFDYWPEKIDTAGQNFFGMDWKIFSRDEIMNFVTEAASYGLYPVGEMVYDGKDKPIDCAGKQYTFGWLALKKSV